ncbi:hypothetical protein LTS18_005894, partial [Coniosporium uncinatum]
DPAMSDLSSDFTQGSSAFSGWNSTAGSLTYDSNGAAFTINKQGDAPTVETTGYIFFGLVEVKMKAAPGQGIVSSIVLESDDLDEIDWEFTGTDVTQVQSNYFGKGDTTTYDRAAWHTVATPQDTTHTYTVNWTSSSTTWAIDGTVVRTLYYDGAQTGARYPQTPMRVKLGIWAGGDPSNSEGTIEWAGGLTDFSAAPFSMYVESVKIENYTPGGEYTWSDNTGSFQSIKVSGSAADDSSSSSSVVSSSSSSAAAVSSSAAASSTYAVSSSISSSVSTLSSAPSSSSSSSSASDAGGPGLNSGIAVSTSIAVSAPVVASSTSSAAASSTTIASSSLLSGDSFLTSTLAAPARTEAAAVSGTLESAAAASATLQRQAGGAGAVGVSVVGMVAGLMFALLAI